LILKEVQSHSRKTLITRKVDNLRKDGGYIDIWEKTQEGRKGVPYEIRGGCYLSNVRGVKGKRRWGSKERILA